MPKVLFLANASSIHTCRWANGMYDSGFAIHLLSVEPKHELLNPKIIYYPAPWSHPQTGYFMNVAYVRRLIRQVQPDLVHAHYASGYGTLGALSGFHPLITSVWGSDVYEFPHRSFLHKSWLQLNLAKADRIVSISHVMAKETRKYTRKVVDVVPWGIDLERFRPIAVQSLFDPSTIVIGTIKALEDAYGINYLLRAFRLLKDKHPDLPLKLLLVGGGTQESALKQLTQELGLETSTLFTGAIKHSDVPRYHNMLTVSVAISNREGFGVSVVESCACERAVVVSNVGGLPEVVENGVSGFVVLPQNPEATAAAIERLIFDEDLRLRMGKAGRERVVRLYNWKDNVSQMAKIYHELL